MTNKATHIIIHHTSVNSDKSQFQAVNNYHKSLGFPQSPSSLLYIGYHWFLERDGTTIRAKKDKDEGAHTLGGWNKKSIGVCLAGDFSLETPSEAQIASLRVLIHEYNLPYLLHSEAQSNRTCPQFTKEELVYWLKTGRDEEDLAKCEAINKELRTTIDIIIQWISKFFQAKK